jgi:glycosyltransferase involved in cell wall biosynthesis
MNANKTPKLSIVIPVCNEAGNIRELIESVNGALEKTHYPWELIIVDDGSSDGTLQMIRQIQKEIGTRMQIVALRRNFGQTAAMQAGIDHASGGLIVTMDGDLQNDPADIPLLVQSLLDENLDLIVGWRKNRKDNFFVRKVPSWCANRLIGKITGVRLHDYGCSLKVYRASVIRKVRLYGEMHRFIPAWTAMATSPDKIGEQVVRHHPRTAGKSKYGLSRSFRVVLDLLAVYFFLKHRAKPGHFFGMIGLIFGFIASGIMGYLAIIKFYYGQNIGTRPLFLVGILLIIASIQFLTTGIVAELLARTYFESSNVKPYVERDEEIPDDDFDKK